MVSLADNIEVIWLGPRAARGALALAPGRSLITVAGGRSPSYRFDLPFPWTVWAWDENYRYIFFSPVEVDLDTELAHCWLSNIHADATPCWPWGGPELFPIISCVADALRWYASLFQSSFSGGHYIYAAGCLTPSLVAIRNDNRRSLWIRPSEFYAAWENHSVAEVLQFTYVGHPAASLRRLLRTSE